MRGYESSSYGDGFADVYDDWYGDVTDVEATVTRMRALAGDAGSVLELGVGTGRLAVPMYDAGLAVTGIDTSAAMLERLAERDPDGNIESIAGDMVDDLPDGPFDAALVAYNTLFNLLGDGNQARCFQAVASRLRSGGSFVVESFVADAERSAAPEGRQVPPVSGVSVRSMEVDRVVLSVSLDSPGDQRASGQFVEFSEAGGVRLRPWSIRWATIEQLDSMAAAAGFEVAERFGSMVGDVFTDDSSQHVTVYRLAV